MRSKKRNLRNQIVCLLSAALFMSAQCSYAQDSISLNLDNTQSSSFSERILEKTYSEEENSFITERLAKAEVDEKGNQNQDQPSFIQSTPKSAVTDYDPMRDSNPRFMLFNTITQQAKNIYNLEIERTDVPTALLKDQLTWKMQKGPLESVHIWTAVQGNYGVNLPERGASYSKYDVNLINVLIDGKFKGGKEGFRIMLDPTHRASHLPFMEPFFQDLYIESNRIPHTNVLIGNSRPGVGIEGAQSPYTLAFINRSQISRNLANIRKFGLRVRGDYSLMDYDIGIYSSSTNFTDFFPGHEFDAWMNLKPLGKTDGRYGKLVTGAGIQSGDKHGTSYNISSAYVGYDYKKFWTKFEYAYANGSNGGSGLTNKDSQGLFVTVGYHLTKKIELLARYDQFDPDRSVKNNMQREYTLGTNYYLKGQAIKLIFNYIYCQNDNKLDSHRLLVGTQFLI